MSNHPPPLSETLSHSQRVIITITVLAATIMEVLDTSIVNVALPNMQGQLGATLDEIGWVSTGYIISNVIVLPLTGWLSDYFGRQMYLFYSVILFTIASFGCGISGTLPLLVFFRILQGIGGAAFLSTAQATLIEIYPKNQQGFAQALFGMGVVMAPTLGPTIGGYLVDQFSWPWIFNVNIPVGIVAAVLIRAYVPNSLASGKKRSPDFLGIGLLAIGLGCLQTILERGQQDDWFDANYIKVLALIALLGLALFIVWELHPKNKNRAIDIRVFKNRNLAAGSVCAFGLGFTLYGTVFLLPQYWQTVQSHTAQQTGLLLFPGGLATAMIMPFVGRFVAKYDVRMLIATGMCVLAMDMHMFANSMTLQSPDGIFFWPLIIRGFAVGMQFVPLSVAALGTLAPRDVSQGAGLYNLFRQLGGSFGIAMLATLLDRRQKYHYHHLMENISEVGYQTQDRLLALQHGLSHSLNTGDSYKQSLKILTQTVLGQAYNMSFLDCFVILQYTSIVSIFLLLLFNKPRRSAGAPSVH